MATSQNPRRILHVFAKMDRGGAETWIMNVFRAIDRERFSFDFLVTADQPGAYDDEITRLGGNVISIDAEHRGGYLLAVRRALKQYGPYDVVHSHVHAFSGPILTVARMAGVPIRIAHSHSDTKALDRRATVVRRLYLQTAKELIRRQATHRLGCSGPAVVSLFGRPEGHGEDAKVLYCGINLKPFKVPRDRTLRRKLGIEDGKFVVGHVARFDPVKNHSFVLRIAEETSRMGVPAHYLMVGDGPLREQIKELIERAGLGAHFTFLGVREDIPRLMISAMDTFILPSLYEGLPLVTLEAQAAGLPSLISEEVSHELERTRGLVEFLPIDDPVVWANRIRALIGQDSGRNRQDALEAIERSSFNIEVGTMELERIYSGE